MKYIWHITLDTGDVYRSPRNEASVEGIAAASRDLSAALHQGEAPMGAPDGYRLKASASGPNLICTVFFAPREVPLVTFAVAARSRGAPKLWGMMHDDPRYRTATNRADIPAAPWCAVRLEPGLITAPTALHWLADYERLIAWSWLEGKYND